MPDAAEPWIAFHPDTRVLAYPDRLVVYRDPRSYVLRGLSPAVRDVLLGLGSSRARAEEVFAALPGPADRRSLRRVLDRVGHLLVHHLGPEERTLMSVVPLRAVPPALPPPLAEDTPVRLSRFALLRLLDGAFVLESPRSPVRIELADQAAHALVLALGQPRTAACLARSTGLELAAVRRITGVLVGLHLAGTAAETGPAAPSAPPGAAVLREDTDQVLRQWDFHDLLFHARSRPVQATTPRFLHRIRPQPAVKPRPPGTAVALHRPASPDLAPHEPGLTSVLETCRATTDYGPDPLRAEQLGEFLYRAARVRSRHGTRPGLYYEWDTRPLYDTTSRPYPSADSSYELELYVTVRRCEALPRGVYHYDPVGHRLTALESREEDGAALLNRIRRFHRAEPDVLITVTSRLGRLSWNHEAISYALTLQHLGILQQTMYLVATAMGLAPCAVRAVAEPETVARVLGLDEPGEVPVGEFLLGSLAPEATGEAARRCVDGWEAVNDPDWTPRDREPSPAAEHGGGPGDGDSHGRT
ncbi:SagB family peptide dehydrogenase [Streptomyces palmae]|uniref:SagB family peptide dehydrogenase n=1 Tax=Streptomyces palmae TaxID=1701085 RepID=UPI001432C23B|nr:SagB family peptide dehydrogenase [Streptomyces palmae]